MRVFRRFFFSPSAPVAAALEVFLAAFSVVLAGALEAVEAGALPAVEAGLGAIALRVESVEGEEVTEVKAKWWWGAREVWMAVAER